eukprot:1152809-Pelagomonas_calceolata.AAC.7
MMQPWQSKVVAAVAAREAAELAALDDEEVRKVLLRSRVSEVIVVGSWEPAAWENKVEEGSRRGRVTVVGRWEWVPSMIEICGEGLGAERLSVHVQTYLLRAP